LNSKYLCIRKTENKIKRKKRKEPHPSLATTFRPISLLDPAQPIVGVDTDVWANWASLSRATFTSSQPLTDGPNGQLRPQQNLWAWRHAQLSRESVGAPAASCPYRELRFPGSSHPLLHPTSVTPSHLYSPVPSPNPSLRAALAENSIVARELWNRRRPGFRYSAQRLLQISKKGVCALSTRDWPLLLGELLAGAQEPPQTASPRGPSSKPRNRW
jgi:hypothetical protein